jgi:hypothetical protein
MGAVNSRLDRIQAEFHHVAGGGSDKKDNLNNLEVEGEETHMELKCNQHVPLSTMDIYLMSHKIFTSQR